MLTAAVLRNSPSHSYEAGRLLDFTWRWVGAEVESAETTVSVN